MALDGEGQGIWLSGSDVGFLTANEILGGCKIAKIILTLMSDAA